jgi:ribosome-associated heat shock protein Hsp15
MTEDGMRIDKWLWHARFFKSRTMATRLCQDGRVRIDGVVIGKANTPVYPGNVLTFPQARDIRVVRVLALGTRRGPASEARLLYEDIPAGTVPVGGSPVAEREGV